MAIFMAISRIMSLVSMFLAAAVVFCISGVPASAAGSDQKTAGQMRIVSLSPAVTESLYLLGMEKNLAGVTTYCSRPKEAKDKEKIGTVMEPDVEKIMKLKPDIVLAMDLTNSKTIKKMKDLGLNVVTFKIPHDFSGVCDVFLKIGRVTGKTEESKRIVSSARSQVARIQKRTSGLVKPRVLIQIGSKPFFVATKDFFINDLIDFAGAMNVFKDAASGSVGREEAIMRNPDVIFVVTMGLSGENERLAWKRFSSVAAVNSGRIYLVDSDDICSPTPVSFARTLGNIAALLHPDETKGWK